MLIDYARGLAFIHIPRTAGTWITINYARHAVTKACIIDLAHHKHLTHIELAMMLHDQCTLFAVQRDFESTCQSLHRLLQRDYAHLDHLAEPWRSTVRRLAPLAHTPADAMRLLWGEHDASTWQRHWLDGPRHVDILPYEDLPKAWPAFCRRHALPPPLHQIF